MSILFSYQIRTAGHFGSSWGNQELSFAAGVRSSGLPSRIVPGGKTKKKFKTYFLCRWQKVTLPAEAERTQVFGSPRLTSMFQEQFPTRVHHRYHQDRLREILPWTFPKWVRWVVGMVWWWWVWWIWYECGGYVIMNTARWVWWQWARWRWSERSSLLAAKIGRRIWSRRNCSRRSPAQTFACRLQSFILSKTKIVLGLDSRGVHGAPARGDQLGDKPGMPGPRQEVAPVAPLRASVHPAMERRGPCRPSWSSWHRSGHHKMECLWRRYTFVKVDMMWSSNQRKNYLHLAAERGLPKVLRLLLERARSEKFWDPFTEDYFDRVQGIIDKKTEEADFTGFLPGAQWFWNRTNCPNVTTTTWQQQCDNVTTICVIVLLDSSPQRPYSLRILPWCLHSSRCLRPRSQIVLLKTNNPPLLHRPNIQSDTDVTRSASQSGCTVLTLMGIALEKQESEKSESFQERESDADDKRCFTSVACDTFKYQSMLGLLLRHSVLDKKLINTRPTNHYVSFHRCT